MAKLPKSLQKLAKYGPDFEPGAPYVALSTNESPKTQSSSTGKSKLNVGQQSMLRNFRQHIGVTLWFERQVDSHIGIFGPELGSDGKPKVLSSDEEAAYIRMANIHGFGLYRDLAEDPRTRERAMEILAEEHSRDRRRRGLKEPRESSSGGMELEQLAEAFDGKPWNVLLDPTKRRRTGKRKDK